MTMPPSAPSSIHSRLVMASVASGRTVPATSSPSAVKAGRRGPATQAREVSRAPAGRPAEDEGNGGDHQDLQESTARTARTLPAMSPGGPAVWWTGSGGLRSAVEPGRDPLAGKCRGHGPERENPGDGDVDPAAAQPVQQRGDGHAHQGEQRQYDGEDQLFPVPEHR